MIAKYVVMRIMKCKKCGYPHNPDTEGDRCRMCGWGAFTCVYEEIEETDGTANSIKMIRLLSEGDAYYDYDPCNPPFREDAWGAYFLGKRFSKKDSCLLKEVVICANAPRWYLNSMWELLKSIRFSEIPQDVFIPIIDMIDDGEDCYLVEDFFDGVSLYDLMHGQVCGVDGQPFEFAVEMYDRYQNKRTDFVKMVIKEILKGVNLIRENNIPITYIELPENIILTKGGKIRIRMIGSLLYDCDVHRLLHFAITTDYLHSLLPIEYAPPEYSLARTNEKYIDERSEVYTVGVFTYCILTGHLPYKGGTSLEDCHCVHGPIIDPRDDNYVDKPMVSCPPRYYENLLLDEIEDKHLKTIVEKATRLYQDKRYQSAQEFIDAIENCDKV